jgi:hypothetical protein
VASAGHSISWLLPNAVVLVSILLATGKALQGRHTIGACAPAAALLFLVRKACLVMLACVAIPGGSTTQRTRGWASLCLLAAGVAWRCACVYHILQRQGCSA